MNTLYDADHLKIALGQISTCKSLIESVGRDYVRLLKYGQSLYQCKQLKRAALGRMATLIKRLKDTFLYLEQVRQHLGRLPSIDPNTRTLVICGFPNVGKSSFLKSVSRADVDVQPYAFTTKSLFCGHFDYKYLRFQCIDTPGILDHPLEEMYVCRKPHLGKLKLIFCRSTIEMQSITALAHLRSAVMYFMDLSEQCGYSVEAQINLFASIKPLFSNKLVFLVINKIDITKVEDLDAETQEKLQGLLKSGEVEMLQLSCNTQEGVQDVKNAVCERLIAERVSQKLNAGTTSSGAIGGRLADVMSRIHVATPMGGQTLQTFIPEGVKNLKKYDKTDPERRRLARDVEEEQGGAGVFNVDLRADYILANPEWKYDKIPEIFDGKNVADFIDPDIEAKLAALEEEEEKLEAEGYYDSDEEIDDEEEATVLAQAELIREKQGQIRNEARMKKRLKNQAIIPRKKVPIPLSKMDDALDQLGVDTTDIVSRARSQSRPRGRSLGRSRAGTEDADAMDLDATPRERLRSQSRARSRSQAAVNRREDGVEDEGSRTKAERMAKLGQKKMNRMARQGEADRHTTASLQRHLLAGKRGMGSTRSR
ncbi:nucleolar GTP-binding protein [Verticillium dahliae VdLs.17]|uniref:Nucleolar GTP-binding protein 1 n=1 Tax=Verticillium dahliae (strain VdLs.17 / ATCC MYA-4575 / FGSC 10137) TaxID=498257 RepID=G2XG18_VERDV|nr:nucleolar GTP-binding protein [Verticillium dahliae VdLs.17]EGY18837.1 nucleolar GTP-binding protein [Verticillium dahliae VdLs.17]